MDRREHHRAQLSLPVRLRWSTPFGQKTELCKPSDISCGGLLVPCGETHALGVPLWVTFPYDPSLRDGQPEMLAQVVRVAPCLTGSNGNAATGTKEKSMTGSEAAAIAVQFQPLFHAEGNGNGHAKDLERPRSPRRPLGVPVGLPPAHLPRSQEAMTSDVSAQGLRFLTTREYAQGANLL